MAKRSHLTRKEMKEDAIQEAGKSLLEFFSEHYHKILTLTLAVVALVLLAVAARGFLRRGAERANADLYSFQAEYGRALSVGDEQTRANMLNAVIESATTFHAKFAGKPAGREALLVKGNSEFAKRDYPAAQKTFEQFVSEAPGNEEKAQGYLGVGDTLANQAFYDNRNRDLLEKAKAAYEQAEKMAILPDGKGSYVSGEAAMGKARAMLMLGELDDARKVYEKIIQERRFYDEPVQEITGKDVANWQELSRTERTRLVRQDTMKRKSFSSFQDQAERRLEEMKGRGAVAASETAP